MLYFCVCFLGVEIVESQVYQMAVEQIDRAKISNISKEESRNWKLILQYWLLLCCVCHNIMYMINFNTKNVRAFAIVIQNFLLVVKKWVKLMSYMSQSLMKV